MPPSSRSKATSPNLMTRRSQWQRFLEYWQKSNAPRVAYPPWNPFAKKRKELPAPQPVMPSVPTGPIPPYVYSGPVALETVTEKRTQVTLDAANTYIRTIILPRIRGHVLMWFTHAAKLMTTLNMAVHPVTYLALFQCMNEQLYDPVIGQLLQYSGLLQGLLDGKVDFQPVDSESNPVCFTVFIVGLKKNQGCEWRCVVEFMQLWINRFASWISFLETCTPEKAYGLVTERTLRTTVPKAQLRPL